MARFGITGGDGEHVGFDGASAVGSPVVFGDGLSELDFECSIGGEAFDDGDGGVRSFWLALSLRQSWGRSIFWNVTSPDIKDVM